ncbi:MAG: pilus assembly protein [Rhodobacterales bacterium]|nr:pilus assembly protein [Rhodobacterales bacterium]
MTTLRAFLADESGEAAIEFLFVFPILFLIFTASVESSMFMARYVMFERAVDLAVRQLRLGTFVNPTHQTLKRTICRSGMMIESVNDCMNSMKIWMQPVNTNTFAMAAPPRSCVDKSQPIVTDEPPANEYATGTDNDIMLMRICMKADPMFPTTAVSVKMPVETDGSYVMLVTTTFVNEPG